MKRNEEHLRVIAYLSAKGKDRNIEVKERKKDVTQRNKSRKKSR